MINYKENSISNIIVNELGHLYDYWKYCMFLNIIVNVRAAMDLTTYSIYLTMEYNDHSFLHCESEHSKESIQYLKSQ